MTANTTDTGSSDLRVFENTSIPAMIRGGYGTLILMILGLLAGTYFVVSSLGDAFTEYQTTSDRAGVIGRVSEDIFEARVSALNYRLSGDTELLQTVISKIDDVRNDPAVLAAFEARPDLADRLEEIIDGSDEYAKAFARVVTLSEEVDAHLEQLTAVGTRARTILGEISLKAFESGDAVQAYRAGVAQEAIMQGGHYATRFGITGQQMFSERAAEQFDQARTDLSVLKTTLFNIVLSNAASDAETALEEMIEIMPQLRVALEARDAITDTALAVDGVRLQQDAQAVLNELSQSQQARGASASRLANTMLTTSVLAGLVMSGIALLIAFAVSQVVAGRIRRLAETTDALVEGDLDVRIDGQTRKDETGRLARALVLFRDGRRSARDQEIREKQAAQERTAVVEALSDGLLRLSEGDLDARMHEELAQDFETLRHNFNKTADQLASAMAGVMQQTESIRGGAGNLSAAADELARRTESQAAALEETAATIVQLSDSVSDTAVGADKANSFVDTARKEAEGSLDVVSSTVEAIKKIQATSAEVSQIIGVIDDIAFQTNLLALNAGVEAARAGDAGQGFAVVASEVRALAQRASNAAKEIKELIETSVTQVDEGVVKADQTGEALATIATMVNDISALVENISAETRNQSDGLKEINAAVAQLDSVTQQNAAMVEETTAASHDLSRNTQELTEITSKFRLSAVTGGFAVENNSTEAALDASWGSDHSRFG